MAELQRLDITISGRVQGVGFRYFAEEVANRLGLVGYVRNLLNGAVEVVAEGEPLSLEEFLAILKKGPPAAEVSDVKARWTEATGEFHEFGIKCW